MSKFWFWLTHNASSAHYRLLARYLERRGWVVFYLDPIHRTCPSSTEPCWLSMYEADKRRQA